MNKRNQNRNQIKNNVFGSLSDEQMKSLEYKALPAPKINLCSTYYSPSREVVPVAEALVAFDTATNSIIKFVAAFIPGSQFNNHHGWVYLISRKNDKGRQNPQDVACGIPAFFNNKSAHVKCDAWVKKIKNFLNDRYEKMKTIQEIWADEQIDKIKGWYAKLENCVQIENAEEKLTSLIQLAKEAKVIQVFLSAHMDHDKLPWTCPTAEFRVLRAYRRDVRTTRFELLSFQTPTTGSVDKRSSVRVIWRGDQPNFNLDNYVAGFFEWTKRILSEFSAFSGVDLMNNLTIHNKVNKEETPEIAAEMLHDHSNDEDITVENDIEVDVTTDTMVSVEETAAPEPTATQKEDIEVDVDVEITV